MKKAGVILKVKVGDETKVVEKVDVGNPETGWIACIGNDLYIR
jgi:hypothetical protein